MNTPVVKLRRSLFLLLAATVACTALTACDEDDHHVRHTYHRGYDRDDHREVRRDYRDDDRRDGYRRDAYYGGGTSVTVQRDAPVVRERSVTYRSY
jgi:hypothetical protein